MTENTPGSWPGSAARRLLRAHFAWIAAITGLAVASAAVFSLLQTPRYTATAQVVVLSEVAPNITPTTPSMGTEKNLAMSDVVVSVAADRLGIRADDLLDAAAVTVPVDSQILDVSCSSPDRGFAVLCAQELGEAYVRYKDTQPIKSFPERARIVTAAAPPISPSQPKTALNLLAGLLVGLTLGVLGALLRDRFDDRVRGEADLDRRGLRVLATAPAPADAGSGAAGTRQPDRDEAYAGLAARVRLAVGSAGTPVVLVTDAAPDDPIDVAPELAAALAAGGDRVVLVRADPRARNADPGSPAGRRPGLLDVLSDRISLAEAVAGTANPWLHVLELGDLGWGVPARIPGRGWARVVDALAERHDIVVVAGAPLTSADGIVVGQHSSAILVVVDDGHTTRTDVDRVLAESDRLKAGVVGSVLVRRSRSGGRRWGRAAPESAATPPDEAAVDAPLDGAGATHVPGATPRMNGSSGAEGQRDRKWSRTTTP